MNTKATIRKILFVMLWISIGGGMLTLLIAAIGKKNKDVCSSYTINIKSNQDNFFIDVKDISKLLISAVGQDLKGEKITDINLRQLEQLLKDNVWIRNAEMWFDNRNVLHVSVGQREPIARIFTTTGSTFYIDSAKVRIPLSDKMSARVPVFTNFPDNQPMKKKDSILLNDIKQTAVYINNDSFWKSQVAQLDINEQQNFEMIPVVGNHIVRLGDGKNINKKFNRLMSFYNQVMNKTGFDAYSIIDVQYEGQVIGTKRGLEKNKGNSIFIQQKQADDLINNTEPAENEIAEKKVSDLKITETNQVKTESPQIKKDSIKKNITSLRATSTHTANPNIVKTVSLPDSTERKPKAIMPKKN